VFKDLETRWNHQTTGKDRGAIRAPVVVRVFEHQHFVVRLLSWLNLRIDGAADDPKTPARVEANLNRLHDTVRFTGEEIDLEVVGDLEGREFAGGIVGGVGEAGER